MKQSAVFLFLLLMVNSLFSKVVDLNAVEDGYLLEANEIAVFEDSSAGLSFSEVTAQEFVFQENRGVALRANSDYWLKFYFRNDSSRAWVLEALTAQTEFISFYKPTASGYDTVHTGHLMNKESRPFLHKNFVFDLSNSDFRQPFYLKIRSSNQVGFVFKVASLQTFSKYSLKEYLLLGLYYGILIVLIFYHLIIYVILRYKVYLFYALSVLFAGLISSSDDGFGALYIWDGCLSMSQDLGLYILPSLFLIAFSGYSISFLERSFEKGKRIILYAVGGYFVIFFGQLLLADDKLYFSFLYTLPFCVIYAVFLLSYFSNKYKPSLYFLIGFSFSLLGLVVNQLRLLGVMEGNVFTVYAFNIGVVLEFLSLALSIGYKYKEERRLKDLAKIAELQSITEKQKAQELMVEAVQEKERVTLEINKTLEVKVDERTKQLNDLIQKLKDLNFDYDKENWDLRRSVRTERHSKLKQEILSLSEIVDLYPNNYKCNEFLAELKWKEGSYNCSKCNYEKFSTNQETFSRKCSRCSAVETATKNSLFHAQKLPLNKLFYLTYLFQSSDKLNVQDLSEELEISEVSLYKFIAKIKTKKADLFKKKREVKSWIDLIF